MPAQKRRAICRYDFDDGAVLEITVAGHVETAQALDIAETLIGLKRKEIGKGRTATLLKTAS